MSRPTIVTPGYYATPEENRVPKTNEKICGAGAYCSSGVRYACGGVDKYCPDPGRAKLINVLPLPVVKGWYSNGSADLNRRTQQLQCPPDMYCQGGEKHECMEGHYCTPHEKHPCGGAEWYCPKGSNEPVQVTEGFFTIPEHVNKTHRIGQHPCPGGFVCESGTRASCVAGYFCPGGNQKRAPCGSAELYCPMNSSRPHLVKQGHFSTPTGSANENSRTGQEECGIGYFCVSGRRAKCNDSDTFCPRKGMSAPSKVDAGFFTTPEGVGEIKTGQAECSEGFYCSLGLRFQCGGVDKYCTKGSNEPIQVTEGFFSIPEHVNKTHRIGQHPCPGGFVCESGTRASCVAGYFCPGGNQKRAPCGSAEFYCPVNSSRPLLVKQGHFSTPTSSANENSRTGQEECGIGYFCVSGRRAKCNESDIFCPRKGMSAPSKVDAGFFSTPEGVGEIKTGHAQCPTGFYCSLGLRRECGGADKYCPKGITTPLDVLEGFYSVPLNVSTKLRVEQKPCPAGKPIAFIINYMSVCCEG